MLQAGERPIWYVSRKFIPKPSETNVASAPIGFHINLISYTPVLSNNRNTFIPHTNPNHVFICVIMRQNFLILKTAFFLLHCLELFSILRKIILIITKISTDFMPLWHRGRVTTSNVAILGSITGRTDSFQMSIVKNLDTYWFVALTLVQKTKNLLTTRHP